MLKKICFILFCLPHLATLIAQSEKGYTISVKLLNYSTSKLYMVGNYGYNHFIADSAVLKKNGAFQFTQKSKHLPPGIYQITNDTGDSFFEILIDRDRNFSITTDPARPYLSASVENSQDNTLFFEYMKLKGEHSSLPESYLSNLADVSPGSLLSVYIKAEEYRHPHPDAANSIKTQFFHGIDWSDVRILRLPIQYGVDVYFDNLVYPSADSVTKEIDSFIEKIQDPEVKRYFLEYLYRKYDNGDPQHDAVLVHLFDRYCAGNHCDWLDDYSARRFAREVKRKRNLLPGQPVPPLAGYNEQGVLIRTDSLQYQYLILWFWDPDCDDCLIETPRLYDIYRKYKDQYGIEVYAVSITEDLERWEQFVNEKRLEWINVSYGKGEPNYDFVEYFDLLTTPGIFLLDKKHTIVDKQFPVDDIMKKIDF